MPRLGFGDYLQVAVSQLRPYAARDPNAGAHLLRTLDVVRDAITDPRHRVLVGAERDRVARATQKEEG